MNGHLLLIDSSGFAHRAYHSAHPTFTSRGVPTWATIGFMSMIYALLERAKMDMPTHGACVFDAPGKNFRHDLFPAYKIKRNKARREELYAQVPYMKHAANALGFEAVEHAGFEADDVLATLARRAKAMGIRTTLVSSDKDMLQLIEDNVIEVVDPVPRQYKTKDGTIETKRKRFLVADVLAKFGCTPDLVPDVQALCGDSVDEIPGIDGIGGKGAGKLISQFGSLEGLLEAANKSGKVVGTPAIRKALRQGADDARLFKRLATLRTDVPIDIPMASLVLHPIEHSHLKEMLRVLEADHKFDVMFTSDPSLTIKLPHNPKPLAWWTKSLKIKQPYTDVPQAGFYKRRLVVGGPWCPARIWKEREKDFITDKITDMDIVHCEVAGKLRNAAKQWDSLARMPILESEYLHRMALGKWASEYDKTSSEANVERPINWLNEPL